MPERDRDVDEERQEDAEEKQQQDDEDRERTRRDEAADEAAEDTFPASDAPAW